MLLIFIFFFFSNLSRKRLKLKNNSFFIGTYCSRIYFFCYWKLFIGKFGKSSLSLSRMNPLSFISDYSSISSALQIPWLDSISLVNGFKMLLIIWRPISNYYLWWIFIWHDDRSNWKSAPGWVGVIWNKWLSDHSSMKWSFIWKSCSHNTLNFGRFIQILITWRVLPSSFFDWICNSNRSPIISFQNMWTSCDSAFLWYYKNVGLTVQF